MLDSQQYYLKYFENKRNAIFILNIVLFLKMNKRVVECSDWNQQPYPFQLVNHRCRYYTNCLIFFSNEIDSHIIYDFILLKRQTNRKRNIQTDAR